MKQQHEPTKKNPAICRDVSSAMESNKNCGGAGPASKHTIMYASTNVTNAILRDTADLLLSAMSNRMFKNSFCDPTANPMDDKADVFLQNVDAI